MSAGWSDPAPAIPWSVPPGPVLLFFGACKKIPDPSVRRENAPSTRGLCFDTREFGRLSPPADLPASLPHSVVGSTWVALARRRFHFSRQKSPAGSPARDRIHSGRAAFANVFAKIPG